MTVGRAVYKACVIMYIKGWAVTEKGREYDGIDPEDLVKYLAGARGEPEGSKDYYRKFDFECEVDLADRPLTHTIARLFRQNRDFNDSSKFEFRVDYMTPITRFTSLQELQDQVDKERRRLRLTPVCWPDDTPSVNQAEAS